MFHLTRRFLLALPGMWLLIGLAESLMLLPLPALAVLGVLVRRHLHILSRVGSAPWASVGFARHVTVSDLARLAFMVTISPLPYLAGLHLRHLILGH